MSLIPLTRAANFRSLSVAPLLAALLLGAGCGTDEPEEECGGNGEIQDGSCDCDAGFMTGEDALTCVEDEEDDEPVEGAFTFAPTTADGGVNDSQDGNTIWSFSALDGDTMLRVEMYESFGAPTAPGTVDLTAVETDYATCGTCLLLQTGCEPHEDHFHCETTFMPREGQVRFDAVGANVGDQMTGELLDVVFQEVTIGEDYSTEPVAGGAVMSLDSWTFDVSLGAL